MTRHWRGNFITLLTLCVITGHALDQDLKYRLDDNKLRHSFNRLLQTVTSVSQERLEALKKFNELQSYYPKVGLRSNDKIVAVIVPSSANLNENTYDLDIHNEENIPKLRKTVTDYLVDNDTILRQWKGCNKSAAKSCTRACKTMYKEVCADFKCGKSMKKAFKKACKRVCNSEFRGDEDRRRSSIT